MPDAFSYKFWGTAAGGERVFFGFVRASGMGEALELGALILGKHALPEYTGLEIERLDSDLPGCGFEPFRLRGDR